MRIIGQEEEKMLSLQFNSEKSKWDGNKNYYYVEDHHNIFLVQKATEQNKTEASLEWTCSCLLPKKAGFPCCHMTKVLLTFSLDFRANIIKKWFIDPEKV